MSSRLYNITYQDQIFTCPMEEVSLMANWFIFDKDSHLRHQALDFHASVNDYFGTLATIVDILRQESKNLEPDQKNLLQNLRDDLNYMQNNYLITHK